jgi:hypothetical protein
MTIINRVLEGSFTNIAEINTLNSVLVFREVSVFGLFTLPIPNLSFITEGLPRLVRWDYSFFGGNAAIIQYFLYALTAGLSFLLFTLIIGLLYKLFRKGEVEMNLNELSDRELEFIGRMRYVESGKGRKVTKLLEALLLCFVFAFFTCLIITRDELISMLTLLIVAPGIYYLIKDNHRMKLASKEFVRRVRDRSSDRFSF